jgi:nucleoside-diphosphate-sugar epimerase
MTDFYQDQNVVVLGGAGFVGRHLCRLLEERGANVYVLDHFSRSGYAMAKMFPYKFYCLDIIRDHYIFSYELKKFAPFAVFNLAAAVAGVEYNQNHHNQMFLDNVQLQTMPVMVCERLDVPYFLQVSSACVYGEDANAPAIESNLGGEPVGANAGYSWAKRMGERAVQWSNLKHAVIVRPSNIYGPGDWYDEKAHVIPKLIKGQIDGTAQYFASEAVREFIYVEDAAEGMLAALEFGGNKETYNLGTNGFTKISIGELHKEIARLTDTPLPPEINAPFDTGDVERYSDTLKINAFWIHKTNLYNGLRKTVEAYASNRCGSGKKL